MTPEPVSAHEEAVAAKWAKGDDDTKRLVQCPACWTAAMASKDIDWECECGELMTVVDLRDDSLAAALTQAQQERDEMAVSEQETFSRLREALARAQQVEEAVRAAIEMGLDHPDALETLHASLRALSSVPPAGEGTD